MGIRTLRPALVTVVASLAGLLCLLASPGVACATYPTLSGHVTDAVNGKPIPSALVTVWYQSLPGFYDNTFADASGAWSVSAPAGDYKVEFSRELYVPQFYAGKSDEASADIVTLAGTSLTGIDAALARKPQGHLMGKITDAKTGAPLPGVSIEATSRVSDPYLWGYAISAADGTYDLAMPLGSYTIMYTKDGYVGCWYDNAYSQAAQTVFTAQDGVDVTGADLAMVREPTIIKGYVQDIDYKALPGISVQLLAASDGHVVDSVATDASGDFVLDVGDRLGESFKVRCHDPSGVLQDQYRTSGSLYSADPADAAVIQPVLGTTYYFDAWMSAAALGTISGHTLDSTGHVVPGVHVRIDRPGEVRDLTSGDDGAYSAAFKVAAHSTFTVKFTPGTANPGYVGELYRERQIDGVGDPVSVAPGQTVTVDSSLTKQCSIQGTLTRGADLVGFAEVWLYDKNGDVCAKTTASSGAYSFPTLREGTYRVFFPGGTVFHDQY